MHSFTRNSFVFGLQIPPAEHARARVGPPAQSATPTETRPHTLNKPERVPSARREDSVAPGWAAPYWIVRTAGRRRWIERLKAEGKKIPSGRKPGSRIVKAPKANSAATERRVVVQLPKQYRHMTVEEFIAAGKQALKRLQERFEKTGRLL